MKKILTSISLVLFAISCNGQMLSVKVNNGDTLTTVSDSSWFYMAEIGEERDGVAIRLKPVLDDIIAAGGGHETGDSLSMVYDSLAIHRDTLDDHRDRILALEAGGGSPTSLSLGTVNSTTVSITSDGGADDVTLPAATTDDAGMLTAALFDEIDANTAKVTNATHSGEVTGSGALTIADDIIEAVNLESTNSASDNQIPSYDAASGGFTWVDESGGSGHDTEDSISTLWDAIFPQTPLNEIAWTLADTVSFPFGAGLGNTGDSASFEDNAELGSFWSGDSTMSIQIDGFIDGESGDSVGVTIYHHSTVYDDGSPTTIVSFDIGYDGGSVSITSFTTKTVGPGYIWAEIDDIIGNRPKKLRLFYRYSKKRDW